MPNPSGAGKTDPHPQVSFCNKKRCLSKKKLANSSSVSPLGSDRQLIVGDNTESAVAHRLLCLVDGDYIVYLASLCPVFLDIHSTFFLLIKQIICDYMYDEQFSSVASS